MKTRRITIIQVTQKMEKLLNRKLEIGIWRSWITFLFIQILTSNIFTINAEEPQIGNQDHIDQYLQIAAKNNPGLKAKFHDYLAAMEQIPQAKSLPDPQVAFGVFVQPVETRVGPQRASLAVSQSFPWFGTLKAQGSVAAQMAEAKLIAFEDEKLKLFMEIGVSFNRLYFLHKAIHLTEENLELLDSFKELVRVNFQSGGTGFVNVLRVEMEQQELKTKLGYLVDSRESALAEFENLLNQKLTETMNFPDSLPISLLPEDKQVLYDSIASQNLKLRELQYQASAKDDQIKVAQMMAKPSFSVGASYINVGARTDMDVPSNGQDAFFFPQVGMRIPLSRKKYRAMEKQAALQKESIYYQIEERTNVLSSQLEALIRDHLDAQRRLGLNRNLYDLAQRSLGLLQTEFTTGKTDFEEVLRMERKVLNYQLELEEARIDNNNAIYNINYLIGK